MDQKVKQIVRSYKKNLADLGITAERSLVFGSFARGKATKHSDIDLLIISDGFKDMDLWERLSLLGRARLGICRPMEGGIFPLEMSST